MFAIAERFSIEAREAAAREAYFGSSPPRTIDDRCPIGVMMQVDNGGVLVWSTPLESEVVKYFLDTYPHPLTLKELDEGEEIYSEADEFIDAWDMGNISDLAEALGVDTCG